jgi:hypothetical protein
MRFGVPASYAPTDYATFGRNRAALFASLPPAPRLFRARHCGARRKGPSRRKFPGPFWGGGSVSVPKATPSHGFFKM